VAKIYSGPVSNGHPFYPGYMPGSEAVTTGLFGGGSGSGWLNVIVPAQPGAKPADFNLAENTMRYLAHKPPQPGFHFEKGRGVLLTDPLASDRFRSHDCLMRRSHFGPFGLCGPTEFQ